MSIIFPPSSGGGTSNVEDGTVDGQMLFWVSSATEYQHTETTELVYDDVNKRVGIGEATPVAKLHVGGSIGTPDTGIMLGDGDTGFYEDVDDSLNIYLKGADKWRIAGNQIKSLATGGAYINSFSGSPLSGIYGFVGDGNTAFHRPEADTLTQIVGGVVGSTAKTADARTWFEAHEFQTFRAGFVDEMYGGLADFWATRVSTGSMSPISREQGWVKLVTGTTTNDEESIDMDDICPFTTASESAFGFEIELPSVTDIVFELGFIEASGGSDNSFTRFMLDTSVGANIYAESSNAGSLTSTIGFIPLASTNYQFWIERRSATEIEFFVNGTTQGIHTTDFPVVNLQLYAKIKTLTNASKELHINWARAWQDRV